MPQKVYDEMCTGEGGQPAEKMVTQGGGRRSEIEASAAPVKFRSGTHLRSRVHTSATRQSINNVDVYSASSTTYNQRLRVIVLPTVVRDHRVGSLLWEQPQDEV